MFCIEIYCFFISHDFLLKSLKILCILRPYNLKVFRKEILLNILGSNTVQCLKTNKFLEPALQQAFWTESQSLLNHSLPSIFLFACSSFTLFTTILSLWKIHQSASQDLSEQLARILVPKGINLDILLYEIIDGFSWPSILTDTDEQTLKWYS